MIDVNEIKKLGSMLVEHGQKLIEMAEGLPSEDTDESTEEPPMEGAGEDMQKPSFAKDSAKEIVIMNLKKKLGKGL
jgi:hypothetical protein